MSAILLDQALLYVRGAFTRKDVLDVKAYGGEFSAEEIDFTSYACPAIFISVLGWSPKASGTRLAGRRVRAVQMAAFVAFKHVDRAKRLGGAMNLAERLSLALTAWHPCAADVPMEIAPLEHDASCENLYGRAVDKKGQALWMVKWVQDVKARVPDPELFELLAVEITENVLPGVVPAAPAPGGGTPLVVTDQINFQPAQEP